LGQLVGHAPPVQQRQCGTIVKRSFHAQRFSDQVGSLVVWALVGHRRIFLPKLYLHSRKP
jgi:hypothetical protein